jgi:hypothetical protein
MNIQVVLTEDARRFADQMGIRLFETSAKVQSQENTLLEKGLYLIPYLVIKWFVAFEVFW